jgi:hypothetical protein
VSVRHDGRLSRRPTRRDPPGPRLASLNAQAYQIADEPDGAVRLVILRFLQRRTADALARADAEALTGGAWGSIEQRAWLALGPEASISRVAAWMARAMGLPDR